MKTAIGKYLEYLRAVKNSSPHTISNYGKDLGQFVAYLSPPGLEPPALNAVTHNTIREFVGHLHDHGLQKSSIARKLAALRSFFKYCVREGHLNENPARLVPTPKLPKRIPSVLSAEEMNGFLNQLAEIGPAVSIGGDAPTKRARRNANASPGKPAKLQDESLLLRRGPPRQRTHRPELPRHRPKRACPARSRQRRQRAHRPLRLESPGSARKVLASARAIALASLQQPRPPPRTPLYRSRIPQLRRPPPHATLRRPHRQKIRPPRQRQLGPAPALAPPRLCHPSPR